MTNEDPEAISLAATGRQRARWRRWLSGLVLAASSAYISWFFITNTEELRRLSEFSMGSALGILALQVLYLVPQAARYRLILGVRTQSQVDAPEWFRLFVVGRLLNNVIPQGGNLYRSAQLKSKGAMDYSTYVGGFLTFTWLSLSITILLALGVTAVANPGLQLGSTPVVAILGLSFLVVVLGPYAATKLIGLLPTSSSRSLLARTQYILGQAFAMPRDLKVLFVFAALSILSLGIAVAIVQLILDGLSSDIGLGEAVLFLALMQASSAINVTPSNLGVQELGFAGLAGGLGIGIGTGLLAGSLVRVSGVVALIIAAAGAQLSRSTQTRFKFGARAD
ncbi:MAG: hypothetical protein HKN91_01025 [Acidimicrobiia bacterium]|nr:hypothetical protein [Acidimicrobiia bacterium]